MRENSVGSRNFIAMTVPEQIGAAVPHLESKPRL
jgi:hypothetical protein